MFVEQTKYSNIALSLDFLFANLTNLMIPSISPSRNVTFFYFFIKLLKQTHLIETYLEEEPQMGVIQCKFGMGRKKS